MKGLTADYQYTGSVQLFIKF